jgi:hypothetical protein
MCRRQEFVGQTVGAVFRVGDFIWKRLSVPGSVHEMHVESDRRATQEGSEALVNIGRAPPIQYLVGGMTDAPAHSFAAMKVVPEKMGEFVSDGESSFVVRVAPIDECNAVSVPSNQTRSQGTVWGL